MTDRDLVRHAARSELDVLRDRCRAIAVQLEEAGSHPGDAWHGVANAAYRLRLARLRARLGAVIATIDAADLALRLP